MNLDLVELLRRTPGYSGQIAHTEPIAARAARYAEPAAAIDPAISATLMQRGVTRLYQHQAAAIDAARRGEHVGIVTATASGKTLCYQVPALEAALADDTSRMVFLFPTKALAHDQLRALKTLADPLGIVVAPLDGDTSRPAREAARNRAQIILSNPDMLHRTLLPDHRRWQALLAGLRFVVLDEAHTYRGVFGTHVALVLRRLRRLCAQYGAAPQFICCSATSANPDEHLAALVGEPVTVIDGDGAPQGERLFVMWNPPVIDAGGGRGRRSSNGRAPADSGQRRSTNVETAGVTAALVRAGVKTLTFTRTRRGAELVLRYAREALERDTPSLPKIPASDAQNDDLLAHPSRIASYRAGYTPDDRRRLERAFLEDQLLGLVSTNALELGIDIGGVDAVVIGGFPGSVASVWQQAGRAGRAQGRSLAVLIAQDDPLDQFYMRHPAEFFARPHEYARIALDNPYILIEQLRCAAAELPLYEADAEWFGATFAALHDWLVRRGELIATDDGGYMVHGDRPAARVNIRSADGDPVELRDAGSGRLIEQIAATRAPSEIHPGAVYLHQGETYLVETFNNRSAVARRALLDYFTQTREETDVQVLGITQQRQIGPIALFLGKVEVTRLVTGYKRKRHYTDEVLSEHDLSMPPTTFRTIAVWWTVPDAICRDVAKVCDEEIDALHAFEHACIGMLPLFAQCDRADIGGLSIAHHPDTGAATVFVYDGVPGGVGIAQIGYEQAEGWWKQTRALLRDCSCLEGCPACIQSPKCGNGNQHLSKVGALTLAALMLGEAPPTAATLPKQHGEPADDGRVLIEDLRGRLRRAAAAPPGPCRAALVVALRSRLRAERGKPHDPNILDELAAIEGAAADL